MDTLGNLITIIKNACLARRERAAAPWSKTSEAICRLLQKEGYLKSTQVIDAKTDRGSSIKNLVIEIAYADSGLPLLTNIKRVSKPGRRQTVRSGKLPRVLQGLGFAIISTPKGIITSLEAKKTKQGGEIICLVW